MVGPGRFMTEIGLGVKTNIFSSMNHMSKMLRFQNKWLFLFPIPSQEALLQARYASLANKSMSNMIRFISPKID